MIARLSLALLLALAGAGAKPLRCPPPPQTVQLPANATSGYLEIGAGDDEEAPKLFFLFYESSPESGNASLSPITLWLQGGPGCASLFGNFYELGPQLVDEALNLVPNPGAWNRQTALLFIDQPVGAGFSLPGSKHRIPTDEMELATDLYSALQAFFKRFPELQPRPLVIAGESYAGKYVPSIGHFILQQSSAPNGTLLGPTSSGRRPISLSRRRPVSPALLARRPLLAEPPLFRLAALAIGNGLTDPVVQVMSHADVTYFQGFLDPQQRLRAMAMQLETVQLISAGLWEDAHSLRTVLLEHIRSSAGVATLLDMRRYEDYDAGKLVDCYLNLEEVKAALGVDPSLRFESCSAAVGRALGPDVMRSVKDLIPDLLGAGIPMLLYQGMHDAQDGAASSEAWIWSLDWEERDKFVGATRHIVRMKDVEKEEGRRGQEEAQAAAERAGSGGGGKGDGSGSTGSTAGWRRLLARQGQESAGQQQELLHPLGAGSTAFAAEEHSSSSSSGGAAEDERLDKRSGGLADKVLAYWRHGGGLTHVILTEAGHMTPRDDPVTSRWMLERWLVEDVLPPAGSEGGGEAAGVAAGA